MATDEKLTAFTQEHIDVQVFDDSPEVGKAVAREIAELIRNRSGRRKVMRPWPSYGLNAAWRI